MRHFILCILLFWGNLAVADNAIVSDSVRANLRSGKAENYRIIRRLPPQTQVEMLLVEQDYAKVRTVDGDVGWLPLRLLNVQEQTANASTQTAVEPAALAATQQELQTARQQVTMLQNELLQERDDARTKAIMATLVGTVSLLFGVLIGIFLHEIYYRKRLNGLRI